MIGAGKALELRKPPFLTSQMVFAVRTWRVCLFLMVAMAHVNSASKMVSCVHTSFQRDIPVLGP